MKASRLIPGLKNCVRLARGGWLGYNINYYYYYYYHVSG